MIMLKILITVLFILLELFMLNHFFYGLWANHLQKIQQKAPIVSYEMMYLLPILIILLLISYLKWMNKKKQS